MDLFEVRVTPKAMAQLGQYIDYIEYTLFNAQAAQSIWQDAQETLEELKTVAGSLKLCSDPRFPRFICV